MKAPTAACASADGAFVVTKDKKNPGPRADRGSKAGSDRGNRHRERFSEWVSRPVRAQAIGGVPEGARRLREDHPQRGTQRFLRTRSREATRTPKAARIMDNMEIRSAFARGCRMERVRAPGRARGRRRHQQARGLGTYKGTGNRNPFHIISGLDGRSHGTRKELVSISTVAAPDFVADAPGLPRKAPVILMERFAGPTPDCETRRR